MKGDARLRERIDGMLGIADSTIQTVKRLSAQLKPALLDDEGLAAAIEWHVADFLKRSGVKCELILDVPSDLDKDLQLAIFRVVQESLTNVVRHAQATEVAVQVFREGDRIRVAVMDDGKGIGPGKAEDPASTGISGMRERIRAFGGDFTISRGQGKGTAVAATFPLKRRHAGGNDEEDSYTARR